MVDRLRGNALTVKIGSDEVSGQFNSVVLQSEDAADDVSVFGTTASDYYFQITGIQSLDNDSFHMFCWDNAESEVTFTFRPLGGTGTAGATDAAIWTGTLIIPARGRLAVGGDANPRGTWTWEARFDCVGEPTKLVA
jgi:hypothetical protein